jgi:hypothetical protein
MKEKTMKTKTIRNVINKKVEEWLETIDDPIVKSLAEKNTIVTGGCIASMLLREPINDFDIYFRNKETTLAIAKYYVTKFKPQNRNGIKCNIYVEENVDRVRIVVRSAGVANENGSTKPYEYFEARPEGEAGEYLGEVMTDPGEIEDTYEEAEKTALEVVEEGKPKYRPVFLSTNAITLSNKLQLILRFFGEPDDIHASYDFVHCTNFWTSWNKEIILRKEALEALLTKELIYVGSKYPLCSIFRLRKFIKRGWSINAGQILKILMQANTLDLTNIDVLQDQLTGVDCAYFVEIISKLKDKDPEKVNQTYLIEILDRMF